MEAEKRLLEVAGGYLCLFCCPDPIWLAYKPPKNIKALTNQNYINIYGACKSYHYWPCFVWKVNYYFLPLTVTFISCIILKISIHITCNRRFDTSITPWTGLPQQFEPRKHLSAIDYSKWILKYAKKVCLTAEGRQTNLS